MAIATAASTATETHQFDTVDVEIREVMQKRVSEGMHNSYDNVCVCVFDQSSCRGSSVRL